MLRMRQKWNEWILAPVFLVLCLCAAFWMTSKYIADIAERACFDTLRQSTQQLGREIRKDVASDGKLLEATARLIEANDMLEGEESRRILGAFRVSHMFSRLELLLPGDRILQENGALTDVSGRLSFADLAAKGAHISGRETDFNGGKLVLRSYQPVVKGGSVQALLCGVIDLETLQKSYAASGSFGQAQVFLLEGKSGNFILDTWHASLGNSNILAERQVKRGYDAQRAQQDMDAARAGQIAFRSKTSGEYFYLNYEPGGVNDWMIMLSMPESVVFANADRIREVLYLLGGFEALLFVSYFAWLLLRARRKNAEKTSRLDRVQYMLQIERILFDVPRNPKLLDEALGEIAAALAAEAAFFLVFKSPAEQELFVSREQSRACLEAWRQALRAGEFPHWNDRFKRHESIVFYGAEDGGNPEENQLLERLGIRSFLLAPVKTLDGELVGALGAVNLQRRWETAALLESVVLSFSMALNNMEAYQTIQKMGAMDQLTGLMNRNRFQRAMETYEKSGDATLACVYADADGLHEMNNQCGHTAGDRLLQVVAEALRAEFGAESVYRIGGDEFVAFCSGVDEAQLWQRIGRMESRVVARGYHVSVGVARRRDVPLVCEMVKQAEQKMYEAKRLYYENRGDKQAVREKNWELEAMLAEKRDLEVFRAVIASKYKGVYIVDLSLDTMRCIYIPRHFEKTAQMAGGKFSAALRAYSREYVPADYWETFETLLDYEQVERSLAQGIEPEVRYKRTDGMCLLLRLYRSPDYSAQKKECIFSFELLNEA